MTRSSSPRVMMVAGESSGDLLGGVLLQELRVLFPSGLEAFGVGGTRMKEAGFRSLHDMNQLSVVGLVEVVRRLPSLVRIFRDLVSQLQKEKPDLLVTIDLPDFNFLLAARAKAMGIPVVHYVSPQVWAWRPGRAATLSRKVDHLLALFPFEPGYFKDTGLPVTFVGHPLATLARPEHSREEVRREMAVGEGEWLVAMLPGSRKAELRRLLPTMAYTCQILTYRLSGVRFGLALAETLTEEDVRSCWPRDVPFFINIWRKRRYDLIAAADVAMVKSGTATLETALLGTPMVVAYRVHPVTYAIGKRVIGVPHISLTNLVAGRALVTERIQDEANPEILASDLHRLLLDRGQAGEMRRGFLEVRRRLGEPTKSAGQVVAEILGKR